MGFLKIWRKCIVMAVVCVLLVSAGVGTMILKENSEQKSELTDHDFQKSIWETATCLKGGYYNNVCRKCGLVETITEAALPHDVEDIIIQEGNCMEDTIVRHICRSCRQQVESDTRFTSQTHKWRNSIVDDRELTYCELCGVVQ